MEPADDNSHPTLVHPNSNPYLTSTGTDHMDFSPRKRGRPRRPISVVQPVLNASVPQVAFTPGSYIGAGCTSEAIHGQPSAALVINPTSSTGNAELSYRQKGRPRKATNPGNSKYNLTAASPTVLRCENKTRGVATEVMDNTITTRTPTSRKYLKAWSFGGPTERCEFCDAVVWIEESVGETSKNTRPKFNICCQKGKVKLPLLKEPLELLKELLDPAGGTRSTRSSEFRRLIRSYSTIYAFTSTGGRVDKAINKGGAPY